MVIRRVPALDHCYSSCTLQTLHAKFVITDCSVYVMRTTLGSTFIFNRTKYRSLKPCLTNVLNKCIYGCQATDFVYILTRQKLCGARLLAEWEHLSSHCYPSDNQQSGHLVAVRDLGVQFTYRHVHQRSVKRCRS